MDTQNILSNLMLFLWPILSIATFVVCLQIQKRNQGMNGPSLLMTGSLIIMIMSLITGCFQFVLINGSFDFSSVSLFLNFSGMLNLVGQVLFLMGLYQFGTAHREDTYDDLLDDLPE